MAGPAVRVLPDNRPDRLAVPSHCPFSFFSNLLLSFDCSCGRCSARVFFFSSRRVPFYGSFAEIAVQMSVFASKRLHGRKRHYVAAPGGHLASQAWFSSDASSAFAARSDYCRVTLVAPPGSWWQQLFFDDCYISSVAFAARSLCRCFGVRPARMSVPVVFWETFPSAAFGMLISISPSLFERISRGSH